MLTLIGRWAIIPTWGLFIAIGNAASGGAVAPPLLPAFYRFVGRFLPAPWPDARYRLSTADRARAG